MKKLSLLRKLCCLLSLAAIISQAVATHVINVSQAYFDGYIRKYGSWDNLLTGVYTTTTNIMIGINRINTGDGPVYYLYRGYFSFDTSGISTATSVTSVSLKLRCYRRNTVNNFDLMFYKVDYGDSLDANDWNAYQSGTYLTSWNTANYPGDGNWITLNLPTSSVNKGGRTQFCLRHAYDDSEPGTTGPRYVYFYSGDAAEGYRAELEINFGHKYAVIIAGGGDRLHNYARYWNDIMFMYSALQVKYGYTDAEIYVLYANGAPPTAANCPDPGNASWAQYTNRIDFAATSANLSSVFNTLSSSMGSNDFLFVFTTDHGNNQTAGHASLVLWGEMIQDNVFAGSNYLGKITSYYREVIVMEQCYSGGFIDDLTNVKRVIMTACTATQLSWPCDTEGQYDEFAYHWISAVNGATPSGTQVNADANSDGIVTAREAYNYAQSHDSQTARETPQYNDPGNIGDRTLL